MYQPWHNLIIQFILLCLIVVIYYSLKVDEKIISNPGSISVCLLGSYIILNSIAQFGHEMYHLKE